MNMGLFNFGRKKTPKEVAKDRLRLILIHDRGDIAPETVDKIKEIFQVLSKYIEIEANDVEIAVTKSEEIEGEEVSPSISCNIPIKGIRGR